MNIGNNPSSASSVPEPPNASRMSAAERLQSLTNQSPRIRFPRSAFASGILSEHSLLRRAIGMRPCIADPPASQHEPTDQDFPRGSKHARGDDKRRLPPAVCKDTSSGDGSASVHADATHASTRPPHMLIFAGDFNFDAGTPEEDALHRLWRDTWTEGGDSTDIGSGCTVDSHLNHMLRNSAQSRNPRPRRYRYDRILYCPPHINDCDGDDLHHTDSATLAPKSSQESTLSIESGATWRCGECWVVGRTPLQLGPLSPPLSGSLSASMTEPPSFNPEDAENADGIVEQIFPSDHFGLVALFSRLACVGGGTARAHES